MVSCHVVLLRNSLNNATVYDHGCLGVYQIINILVEFKLLQNPSVEKA
jgi:hypothetical protein